MARATSKDKDTQLEDVDFINSELKKLTISNFCCIGQTPVSIELNRIVVLVGANNAGKSTILKAYQYAMDDSKISLDDCPNGEFDENNPPSVELEIWLGSQPGNEWLITDEQNGRLFLRQRWIWEGINMKPKRQGWSNNSNKWSSQVPWGANNVAKSKLPKAHRIEAFASPQERSAQVTKLLLDWIKEKVKSQEIDGDPQNPSTLKKIKNAYKQFHEQLLIETEERVTEAEKAITDLLSNVFSGYKIKFDVVPNESVDKIIDGLLTNPSMRIGPTNGHLADIKDQGSGTQRTLLWTALKFLADEENKVKQKQKTTKKIKEETGETEVLIKQSNILLMDEPEICLHPSTIREACKTLYQLAEKDSCWQIMVTTHSPIFIDFSRDHTTVVRVQRNEAGIISSTTVFRPEQANLTPVEKDNLKLLNLWDPYIAEFFFGGTTILVEGDTEYAAFKHIISEKPDEFKDIHIIRARGKAILVPLIKILNHFGQPYSVLHDADTPQICKAGKMQTNSMWSENEKIKAAVEASNAKVLLVAAIKDFETALFDQETTRDKPYTTWKRLQESDDKLLIVYNLLKSLVHHCKPIPDGFLEWDDIEQLKSNVNMYISNNAHTLEAET